VYCIEAKRSFVHNDVLDVDLAIVTIREKMAIHVGCCVLMSLLSFVNIFSKCLFTSHRRSTTMSSHHGLLIPFLFILHCYFFPSSSKVQQSKCRASKMSQKQARRPLGPNPVPESSGHEIHSDFLMKGNRVADLRAEASTNSRPDSKRGLKATIKLQQEAIKTQTQQIETLKKTNEEQNVTIQRHLKHIGSLEDNDARFGQPLLENPFEGGRLFDTAAKNLRKNHKDSLDHISKEPNAQFVAQSIFGFDRLLQEWPAKPTEEPNCSNCRIMETQRKEDKDLIQRLHQKIAELEAIKEPEDSCIDKTEINRPLHKRLSKIMEDLDAELRDSYEEAFRAIFEGQRQEDKDTIARLLSRNADLEASIESSGKTTNELREQLDVIKGRHEDMTARLQEKMEKLDAALGRLTAAEDEETKKPAALVDSEQETTRREGKCIMS